MFGKNFPAKFQTSKKSTYVVDETSVTRDKPADPKRMTKRQEKSIFYMTEDNKAFLSRCIARGFKPSTVYVQGDEYMLKLSHPDLATHFAHVPMTHKPAVGLSPIDMFLENNGALSASHRFHHGHPIVTMM
jgi:hypothetical protein